jgi:hypothetical protein
MGKHQTINIKEPLYHQNYIFQVYENKADGNEFAAIEFSNCIWGIYLKDKN